MNRAAAIELTAAALTIVGAFLLAGVPLLLIALGVVGLYVAR